MTVEGRVNRLVSQIGKTLVEFADVFVEAQFKFVGVGGFPSYSLYKFNDIFLVLAVLELSVPFAHVGPQLLHGGVGIGQLLAHLLIGSH